MKSGTVRPLAAAALHPSHTTRRDGGTMVASSTLAVFVKDARSSNRPMMMSSLSLSLEVFSTRKICDYELISLSSRVSI